MIPFKARFNGGTVEGTIPVKWDEVTFEQFLKVATCDDDYAQVLSVFLNIKPEILKTAKIKNLDSVITCLSFLKKECPTKIPDRILFYRIPKDLGFESIGQMEDINQEVKQAASLSKIDQLAKFPLYCAVYACKHMSAERCKQLADELGDPSIKFREYHWKKAEAMQVEFFKCPAPEVLGIGNFTLLKLIDFKIGINPSYRLPLTRQKKFRLVLKRWWLRSGLPELWSTWKEKLALVMMNFKSGQFISSITGKGITHGNPNVNESITK